MAVLGVCLQCGHVTYHESGRPEGVNPTTVDSADLAMFVLVLDMEGSE